MTDVATVLLVVVALSASFFAAWTIGAGSSGSTPFAPAVGARAITTMRAAFIVGLLAFAGAVFQGAAITETIGAGLIGGVTLSPLAAVIALVIASIYIAVGVFTGYPIATAFAVTGSIVGVGLAMGGDPVWGTYTTLVAYWLVTPIVVAPPAYVLTKTLRGERVPNARVVPILAAIVGVTIATMEFLLLGSGGEGASIAGSIARFLPLPDLVGRGLGALALALVLAILTYRDAMQDPIAAQRRFLLALGGLMAFTAGAGKVGLAVGPLIPLFDSVWGGVPIWLILAFGAIGMLVGTWMAAPRMIKALTQDYSMLGPRRAIAILVPSFVIAQIGVLYGLPMAFNQIFIAAVAGVGYAVGPGTVSERKLVITALAWIGSIAFGLAIGYGLYAGVTMLTGWA